MTESKTTELTITDALNAYAARCMTDGDFRLACCHAWRDFGSDSIGDDIASYTGKVIRKINWEIRDEQLEAIRRFPPEALQLLRSFIVQFLDCPKPGPTPLHTRYEWVQDPISSITVRIDDHNDALVTLRAPQEL